MSEAHAVTPADRSATSLEDLDLLPPAVPLPLLGALLLAVVVGALVALALLPAWMPGLDASLSGAEPRAAWYLTRTTAFVAYILLWMSMVLGLMITNKMARIWPGGPVAFDIHQYTSLLGLGFALFHALILLGETYVKYGLIEVLIPFASVNYAPFWVGLGQLGFYLLAAVALSFYVRRSLGRQAWRAIHFLSFAMFLLALLHGLGSGTDTKTGWAVALYLMTGGSVLFLTLYRVLRSQVYDYRGQVTGNRG